MNKMKMASDVQVVCVLDAVAQREMEDITGFRVEGILIGPEGLKFKIEKRWTRPMRTECEIFVESLSRE